MATPMGLQPVVLLGPTASGKSSLAAALWARYGGEVVSADAVQVYRGFDLGTAKPDAAERARIPHHLVDILDPAERFSAGEFARRARAVLDDLESRGLPAWVVGGTGLYLRALFQGLAPIPEVAPEVRAAVQLRLARDGVAALYDELARRDPRTAGRLGRADGQRIARALAVALSSGRPLSEWIENRPFAAGAPSPLRVGLTLSRTVLYDRIARRVGDMLRRGWADEVRSLLQNGISPAAPAFQAIGYRQLAEWTLGRKSLQQATAEIVTLTRRYAKRQATWFRREPGVVWFDAEDVGSLPDRVARHLEERGWGAWR